MKLFPVALAVFAFASCSESDDLMTGKDNVALKSNELLVTVENLNGDATRAGFVEAEVDGKLKRVTVFNPGDVLKIYDDANNWRPQNWTYSGTTSVHYTNADGAAGGDAAIFQAPTPGDEYESGYGIYPAEFQKAGVATKFGKFMDEDRTTMEFDFDALKVFSVNVAQPSNLEAGNAYKNGIECSSNTFPVPMWGVAANQKMTLKYLTAFLRLDIAKVPAAAEGSSKWLLIESNKALTGTFEATIADPDNATTGLKAQAPVLVAPDVVAYTGTYDAIPKTGVATCNNQILVNIGRAGGDIVVYIPISAGATASTKIDHLFKVMLSGDVSNADAVTTIDFTAAGGGAEVGHSVTTPVAKSVYRGQTYSIVDDSRRINDDATSPFQMVQAIIAADKEATRDFTLSFNKTIQVNNSDDAPQKQWIDFSNTIPNYGLFDDVITEAYELKHNVTINATVEGVDVNQVLKIHKIGGKKLTLNIAQVPGTTKKVNVLVDEEMATDLILDGEIPVLINKSNDHLTAKGTGSIVTSGKMVIDRAVTTTTTQQLYVLDACQGVNIKSGKVGNVKFAADETHLSATYSGNAAGCNIYTENVQIEAVDFSQWATVGTTAATKDFAANCLKVKFTSKLPKTGSIMAPLATITGASTGDATSTAITAAAVTAHQLKNAAGAVRILASEISMNEDRDWEAKTAHDLNGDYRIYPTDSKAFAAANVLPATIKDLKLKATTVGTVVYRGFFSKIANEAIANVVFDNVKVSGAVAADEIIGALAGEMDATGADAVINNIEVKGLDVQPTTSDNVISVGGLLGKVTNTTNLTTLTNIKTAGTIKAYGNLGGIVGLVAKTAKLTFGQKTDDAGTPVKSYITGTCNGSAVAITEQKSSSNYGINYAKIGQFVGGIETTSATEACNVIINLNEYTEAARTLDEKAKATFVTTTLDNSYHAITLNQSLVGYSGYYTHPTLPISEEKAGTTWFVTVNVVAATKAADKAVATVNKYRTTQVASPTATDKILCVVAP